MTPPTPTPSNPEITTAVSRYVESADTRPSVEAFTRLDNSSFAHMREQMLRAEDSLSLMRGNSIDLSGLSTNHLPPGGRRERYWISPATATLRLRNGDAETVIPADGTERTVAGITIKRLAAPEGGRSIIEIQAAVGQSGRRSFLLSDGETAFPPIEFDIRARTETRAESHFETRQQIMTAALERMTLEQQILSASTDRAMRARAEANLARLRELNLKLTADQAREMDIYQFVTTVQSFAREYNDYVAPRERETAEAARQRVEYARQNRATIEALNEQMRALTLAGEIHSWLHARHRNVSLRENDAIVMPDEAMMKKMGDFIAWMTRNEDPTLPPPRAEVEQVWNTVLLKIRQFRTTQNDANRNEVDGAIEGCRTVMLAAIHRVTQQRGWLDAGSVGPAFGDIFGVAQDPTVRVHASDVSVNDPGNVRLLPAVPAAIELPRAGRQSMTVPAGELLIGGTALANGASRAVGPFTFQRTADGLTLTVSVGSLAADTQQDIAIRTAADGAPRTIPVSFRRRGTVQNSNMAVALRTGLFIQRHRTAAAAARELVSSPHDHVPEAIGLTPGYPRHAITGLPSAPLTVNGTAVPVDAARLVIGPIRVSRMHEGRIMWVEPANLSNALERHRVTVTGGGANITTHINFTPGAGDRGANPIRDALQEARTIRQQYFVFDNQILTNRLQMNELLTLQGSIHALPMPEGWNGGIGVLYETGDVPFRTALEAWLRDNSVANTNALRDNINRLLAASGLPQSATAENVQAYVESSKAGVVDILSRSRNQPYLTALGGWLRDGTAVAPLVTAANAMLRAQRPPLAEVAANGNIERLMRLSGCGHVGLVLRSSVDRQFNAALQAWRNEPENPGNRDAVVAHANRVLLEIRPPFSPSVVNAANVARVFDLSGLSPRPAVPEGERTLISTLRDKLVETGADTLALRNAYNRWLIRHSADNATLLVTQCNAALGRAGDPYVTAANLTQKLELAGRETREAAMRGPVGVISVVTYHAQFNTALEAYRANTNHISQQRMFEAINAVLSDAGMPPLSTQSQVRYILQIANRLSTPRAGSSVAVQTLETQIEAARSQSYDALGRYYDTWNARLERGATVQELSEHLLTMGGVMRNDPFAELSQAVDRDRQPGNISRNLWDYSPIGLLHSGFNAVTGRPEWSSTTHVRNGSFYGIRHLPGPAVRMFNQAGELSPGLGVGWYPLATPTSEASTILQSQGVNIDGFDEASMDARADMLREQLPDEIRKTLLEIRTSYQPRMSGPQGSITLASANHQLLNDFAGRRPASRLTGAAMRPPENRPSDYEQVHLLGALRRRLIRMPPEDRVFLEAQAQARIAAAAAGGDSVRIPENLDGTPARPLTGLPAWVTGAEWPANEGDFEGLDEQQAVYAYVVLMNRFRSSATPRADVQASIDALPALSDLRTNDDAAGQTLGMYRYLLDRQAVLQEGVRLTAQDYSLACARAVELHIMQAQTNRALQGSNNLDALLAALAITQWVVIGNVLRQRGFGRVWGAQTVMNSRIPLGLRVLNPVRTLNAPFALADWLLGRVGLTSTPGVTPPTTPATPPRVLVPSEAANLQRNVARVREIAQEVTRLRAAHTDEVAKITKQLQTSLNGLDPVADAARIQQLQAQALRDIQAANQANGNLIRQLQAERTNLGRNIATSLDGVDDLTRLQWARALMGGDDAVRALGRTATQMQALERGIIDAHNIGRGRQLTDLAVDAAGQPIMRGARQLNVRDAKWARIREAFDAAGLDWANPAHRAMARNLMDGACGQGAARTVQGAETLASIGRAAQAERALVVAAVRAGRLTAQEGRAIIALMQTGRMTQQQLKILQSASRGGELTETAAAALRASMQASRFGRFLHAGGQVLAFAGLAFDAYTLVSETAQLVEGRKRIREAMQTLSKQLRDNGFQGVGEPNPETGVHMRYRHPGSGFTVDVDNMETQLQWINATEHGGRMLGAGLGIGLFATSLAVGGPVGLAIAIGGAIITIVITTAAEAWSDLQRAQFLYDAPPFLFMVWNSSHALGKRTHDMMKQLKESSFWRSFILGTGEVFRDAAVQRMYPVIEKKLAFQLMKEELSSYAPAVLAAVLQGTNGPTDFGTFFDSATGFGRIYEFWGEELGAITGKNMNERNRRAEAVGDELATRRAMRYAVARHVVARNAEESASIDKKTKEILAVLAQPGDITLAQIEPFLNDFPQRDRDEVIGNGNYPLILRQQLEALLNHLEIRAEMLRVDNVDVGAMGGAYRDNMTQRMRLYRAAFKDPVVAHQLQHEYKEVEEEGSENRVTQGMRNAVTTIQLIGSGLPQDNWELARMHLLNLGGRRRDIDALMPENVSQGAARRHLTRHISGYAGTSPNNRFVHRQSQDYFPRIANPDDRPNVYVAYPEVFYNNAQKSVDEECRRMADVRTDFPGLTDDPSVKMMSVAFNVVPIRAQRWRRTLRPLSERLGPGNPYRTEEFWETQYLICATFHFQKGGQVFVGTKGTYMYQNPRQLTDEPRNMTTWYTQRGSMELQDYLTFLGPSNRPNRSNRALDQQITEDLQYRMTQETIARSEFRYGPRARPEERPSRFRRVAEAEPAFRGRNRPAVFISAPDSGPNALTFDRASPEYALCEALASPPTRMHEEDPVAVFVEFERRDNELFALASYVDSTTLVRRRSARATISTRRSYVGGERRDTTDGVVHVGTMMSGVDINTVSALRHFVLNGGTSADEAAPLRVADLDGAVLPPLGVHTLGDIQQIVKRRNRERLAAVLAQVEGEPVDRRFVPAGTDEAGCRQYLMLLVGEDNGQDAYVIKTVRDQSQALMPPRDVRVRINGTMQTVRLRYPSNDHYDSYTYHSTGNHPDHTISFSNLNEMMNRPHFTFRDRELAMRMHAAGHERRDAEPVQMELMRFLASFPTQTRTRPSDRPGQPAIEDSGAMLLAIRLTPAYEAATNKQQFLWHLADRIREVSHGVILIDNLDLIMQDVGTRPIPRSHLLPVFGEHGLARPTGRNEYTVLYTVGEDQAAEDRLATLNESPVIGRGYAVDTVDRRGRDGSPGRALVRRYGSISTVVRTDGFVHHWGILSHFHDRTGDGRPARERREILDHILLAPSNVTSPAVNNAAQMREFLRPVERILDGWMYDERSFDVVDQFSRGSDGRSRFARIVYQMYFDLPADRRRAFLRALFETMETVDGSDGQHDGILSHDWRTPSPVNIDRELEGARLAVTFQSVIMELRRRFPVPEDVLARESLRSLGRLPTPLEVAFRSPGPVAAITSSTVGGPADRSHVFARSSLQAGTSVQRDSAVRLVPSISSEANRAAMHNWSLETPVLEDGVTAVDGIAQPRFVFVPHTLSFPIAEIRTITLTNAAPQLVINEMPSLQTISINGTLVPANAVHQVIGPLSVTRTNNGQILTIVRANSSADVTNHRIHLVGGNPTMRSPGVTLPDIRFLKSGGAPPGRRAINATSRTFWREQLSIPVEKSVGRLMNAQPLRDLLNLCAREFNRDEGIDRKFELFRGLSELYWRTPDQQAFLVELVNVLSGETAIDNGAGGTLRVDGIIRQSNLARIVAHMTGRFPMPPPEATATFRDPPETAVRGSPEYIAYQMRGLRTRVQDNPTTTAEDLEAALAELNEALAATNFTETSTLRGTVGDPIALSGNSAVLMLNEAGQLAAFAPEAVTKGAVDLWRAIIDAPAAQNAAGLRSMADNLEYLMKGVHCMNRTVDEIESADPKVWRLPNHLLNLRMNGEDAFAFEDVEAPTVDGLFGAVREAAVAGRWQEVDEACGPEGTVGRSFPFLSTDDRALLVRRINEAFPRTTSVRLVFGGGRLQFENIPELEMEERLTPGINAEPARAARREAFVAVVTANPASPSYAKRVADGIATLSRDYARTPPENRPAYVEQVNGLLAAEGVSLRVQGSGDALERAPDENVLSAIPNNRVESLIAAGAVAPPAVSATVRDQQIALAIQRLSPAFTAAEGESARAAFVAALNRTLSLRGLPLRVRANGDALERAPDGTPVGRETLPALNVPELPYPSFDTASQLNRLTGHNYLYDLYIRLPSRGGVEHEIQISNPEGRISNAERNLLRDFGITFEATDTGSRMARPAEGNLHHMRLRFARSGNFQLRFTYYENGDRRPDPRWWAMNIPETAIKAASDRAPEQMLLRYAQLAARDRWSEVSCGPAGTRYYYESANRRLHSFDGTQYRRLNADYTWTPAVTARPDGLPAAS